VLRNLGIHLAPYAMVTVFFTGMYMLIPNTRVQWRPALIGAVVAGVLWAAVGRVFTEFVVYSIRLQVIYAGFAFIVAALLWTYFGWLILLAGAQLSFYIQNPKYLRFGLWELRLSNIESEQLGLKLMYLVARSNLGGEARWTEAKLATELGLPGIAMTRLMMAFQQAGLLTLTETDELVPSRDIGRITVCEILDAARNQRSGQITPRSIAIPSVDRLIASIEEARRARCGTMTLRDLLEESPRPALTLAARRD
jgi:membrane protein